MGVEFDSGWDQFEKMLKDTDRNFKKEMGNATMKAAEIVRANVTKGIRDQKWTWPKLAESTLERKKGEQILIDHADYFSSFTTNRIDDFNAEVGTNHPQGRALEFGFEPRNLPARAHLGPAFAESLEEIGEVYLEAMDGMLKND